MSFKVPITDPSLGNQQLQAQLKAQYAQIVCQLEQQAEHRYKLAQAQIHNLERRWQDAAEERKNHERELRASAARAHDRRIIAERERDQAVQASAEKEWASSARERFFEPARERGGYEEHPRRRYVERERDRTNTVKARPDSAEIPYRRRNWKGCSETKMRREKHNGQPYKTFICYYPKAFSRSGCNRPFDVVNPDRGKIQCCYCRKTWTIWGGGKLR